MSKTKKPGCLENIGGMKHPRTKYWRKPSMRLIPGTPCCFPLKKIWPISYTKVEVIWIHMFPTHDSSRGGFIKLTPGESTKKMLVNLQICWTTGTLTGTGGFFWIQNGGNWQFPKLLETWWVGSWKIAFLVGMAYFEGRRASSKRNPQPSQAIAISIAIDSHGNTSRIPPVRSRAFLLKPDPVTIFA